MDKNRDEFEKNFKQLNKKNQRDTVKYLRVLIASEKGKHKFTPPTAEQWQRVPGWLKWKIAVILFAYTWESLLAEIGLRLAGVRS